MTDDAVRPARARDLPLLAAIEDSGLAMFEAVLGDLTGDALASPAASGAERVAEPGFILVAGDPAVGFAHVRDLESHAHLDQLSVHPDPARRGVGTALLEAAAERAAVRGHGSLTLTTYADIAWNAPFYARHGFVEFAEDDPRTAARRAMSQHEEELGLERHGRRIWMRRVLRSHRTSAELDEFLAQDPEREVLAGDQLYVDLDLSHATLPAWSELHIGGQDGAVIVVTEVPHHGCGSFIARFGKEAMAFVNGPVGKPRRLRGLCAKVVRPGPVRPGDEVVVVRPGT